MTEEGIVPPVPGEIFSIGELEDYLRAAAARRPHALRMDLPGEFRAWIHIGGPLGAVHLCKLYRGQPVPADPSYFAWIAMPDRPLPMSEYVSFLTEGSRGADDIYGDQLLPVDEVISIAVYLAEYRALPSTHGWLRPHGNGSYTYVAKSRPSEAGENAPRMAPAEPFSPMGVRLRDNESFFRAIAANPKDRQLRRLYADWLEALYPRQCELIRVCEAMRDVPVWSDRYWELKARRNQLWEQCPLEWLEATGYDGSYYDPIFRDGVPDGCRERWRLIREFTERWHGIPVPDGGGGQGVVRQAEERLGLTLPPSLREYVAYVYDLAECGPAYDPQQYNTLFHSAYCLLHHLHRHEAISLIHFTLSSTVLGVAHEDLGAADPRTYFFDEVLNEKGNYYPPSSPIYYAPSLSLSIFSNLFIQLPTAGDLEARGANPDDWLPRLARDFPIHACFDNAHIFETDELLVLVSGSSREQLVEAVVRRPIPEASVPPYLFGGSGPNIGSAGMLGPESYRRELEAGLLRLGQSGVPQPAWCERVADPAHFDLRTYIAWVRYAGRYPIWMSILRRREAERLRETADPTVFERPPPPPDVPEFDGSDDIPF